MVKKETRNRIFATVAIVFLVVIVYQVAMYQENKKENFEHLRSELDTEVLVQDVHQKQLVKMSEVPYYQTKQKAEKNSYEFKFNDDVSFSFFLTMKETKENRFSYIAMYSDCFEEPIYIDADASQITNLCFKELLEKGEYLVEVYRKETRFYFAFTII